MKLLWDLFAAFFRIGLFTFGGGYAMLPMLEKEVVERHGWSTREDLLDYFAISQCTPGIIAVNTATLIGYTQKKLPGAIAAALGTVTPSLVIIMLIAALLQNFTHIPQVQYAFAGIRVAVCALIAASFVKLFKSNVLQKPGHGQPKTAATFVKNNWLPLLLCLAAFLVVAILGASPIYVVVGAVLAGLLFYTGKREAPL